MTTTVLRLATLVLVAGTALATPAVADILVLKDSGGRLFITNRGEKSGYKVISRYREFGGSSGLGLRGRGPRDSGAYDDVIQEMAGRFSIDAGLVKAVIRAESGFNPRATSPKGAMGLMQLM